MSVAVVGRTLTFAYAGGVCSTETQAGSTFQGDCVNGGLSMTGSLTLDSSLVTRPNPLPGGTASQTISNSNISALSFTFTTIPGLPGPFVPAYSFTFSTSNIDTYRLNNRKWLL